MKRYISALMALLCMLCTFVPVSASDEISVYVNDEKVLFDVNPVIIEGRTLVPLRAIFEELGAIVEWNNDTRSVTAVRDDVTVSLAIGSNVLNVNDIQKTLDVPAQIIDSRTLVPVRAISEAFECDVEWENETRSVKITTNYTFPEYTDSPFAVVNNNEPYFNASAYLPVAMETYATLDNLGRCGVAFAILGQEIMPTAPRESISSVRPTGWHSVSYDIVDGDYLYNRCHLIGFQLSGENANERNLITGTRYLNVEGMLPFENMIADYIKETGNHVIYRVTPVFSGDNLLADGVLLEAESIEDGGAGIQFCVYCYNVQPGVIINYADGRSSLDGNFVIEEPKGYILNTSSKKFHEMDCGSAAKMNEENREETDLDRETLISMGYSPCGNCDP